MRVGISSFVLQGGKTGVATYIRNLIDNLGNAGSEIEYRLLLPGCEVGLVDIPGDNFKVRPISSMFKYPVQSILWHNLFLPSVSAREKLDVLHIPTYRRVPAIKTCPIVATVHDLATLRIPNKYGYARRIYNQNCVPHLLKVCDHIIAVSENTKSDIMHYIGYPEEKITVSYPGINGALYRPLDRLQAMERVCSKLKVDGPFLLYVSRIEAPGKNHIRLMQAFEELKSRFDMPHKLVFVGEAWNGAEQVFSYAEQSRFRDEIRFLGFVDNDDVVDLYNSCDLVVHPSLYEGFGFPLLEASACGAPVICSRSSSMLELSKDRFLTFDPYSVDEMRDCIAESLKKRVTETERQTWVDYGQSFTWSDTAMRVKKVYESVV